MSDTDGLVTLQLSAPAAQLLRNLLAGPTPVTVPLSDLAGIGALLAEVIEALDRKTDW